MKKIVLVINIVAVLLSSCTTLQTISYERLKAADVNFPEQVRSVGVVNCVPLNDWNKEMVDHSTGSLEGNGKIAAEMLAQEIAATDYFNQVVICDSLLSPWGKDARGEEMLPGYLKDSLIQVLGVDMLFSVERLQIKLQENTMFLPEVGMDVPVIDGMIAPVIRTYIAGREAPLFTMTKADTICWELSPTLTYGQMQKDASEHAATLPMEYLLPHWRKVDRYYFDGGNVDMRDAGVYVREQNWDEAAVLWKKVYDTKKGKNRMRAAFNLAVYHELQDDFEQAKAYLQEAAGLAVETSWEGQLILFYQLKLEESAKDNHRLKVQMKRFEP